MHLYSKAERTKRDIARTCLVPNCLILYSVLPHPTYFYGASNTLADFSQSPP